ncbi:uncharacterized protein BO66DRAFT_390535 [Aspergillus aculeatinus CBS 121060]|uniref:Uncharacterized protein n=1 Tax=Aspergillus aculeatinus CBS 121060 TaxID=1448322 RepID=A0ACD1HDL3_9EURO|nr:hypothetical protein BO66DRAFT_390535 [Aspergillus aculeatinus CBS 121060]RAH71673.1 hypothetical protein BO66DRAFT_390535 [Aspergillus aculeatinus CBS 121060]
MVGFEFWWETEDWPWFLLQAIKTILSLGGIPTVCTFTFRRRHACLMFVSIVYYRCSLEPLPSVCAEINMIPSDPNFLM